MWHNNHGSDIIGFWTSLHHSSRAPLRSDASSAAQIRPKVWRIRRKESLCPINLNATCIYSQGWKGERGTAHHPALFHQVADGLSENTRETWLWSVSHQKNHKCWTECHQGKAVRLQRTGKLSTHMYFIPFRLLSGTHWFELIKSGLILCDSRASLTDEGDLNLHELSAGSWLTAGYSYGLVEVREAPHFRPQMVKAVTSIHNSHEWEVRHVPLIIQTGSFLKADALTFWSEEQQRVACMCRNKLQHAYSPRHNEFRF